MKSKSKKQFQHGVRIGFSLQQNLGTPYDPISCLGMYSRSGLLNCWHCVTDNSVLWRAVLCIVGCLAGSLASTCYMPGAHILSYDNQKCFQTSNSTLVRGGGWCIKSPSTEKLEKLSCVGIGGYEWENSSHNNLQKLKTERIPYVQQQEIHMLWDFHMMDNNTTIKTDYYSWTHQYE